MPSLKTRKQLRHLAQSTEAELAKLKTPEGMAEYLFSQRADEVFAQTFHDSMDALVDNARSSEATEEPQAETGLTHSSDTEPPANPSEPTLAEAAAGEPQAETGLTHSSDTEPPAANPSEPTLAEAAAGPAEPFTPEV